MASSLQLKPPNGLSLEGNVASNWKDFKRAWRMYSVASELTKKDEKIQIATFLHVAGIPAQKVHETFTFTNDEKDKIEPLISKFEAYCEPKKNTTVCRYLLNSRLQHESESFTDFLTALRTLLKDCELPADLANEFLRDRIVCGVRDQKVRERLLRADTLTLERAIDICKAAELSAEQIKSLTSSDSPAAVNAVQKHGNNARKGKEYPPCPCCPYSHDFGKCPARGKTCAKCHKSNHFAAKCKSQPAATGGGTTPQAPQTTNFRGASRGRQSHRAVQLIHEHEAADPIQEVDYEFIIDEIRTVKSIHTCLANDWTETCTIGGVPVKFKLDTGSQVNILPEKIFCVLPEEVRRRCQPSCVTLKSYSNHLMNPIGQFTMFIKPLTTKAQQQISSNERIPLTFQVVKGEVVPILGKDSCEKMGLLKRVHQVSLENGYDCNDAKQTPPPSANSTPTPTNTQPIAPNPGLPKETDPAKSQRQPSATAMKLVHENQDLFEGLGCLKNREYNIEIDPSVPPVQLPPRQVPYKIADQTKAELDRMMKLGVIEPVHEPTPWVNQMTTVLKKSGQVRVCLDPRELNKAIRRHHYPTTTLEQVAARMPNAKVFSKFDATSGYWQLKLTKESSLLTTFNTPWGRFKFNRLPFGISSAGEIWQRAMVEEFGDLEGLEIIVDDMLLTGDDDEQHDARLAPFLSRVRDSGLKFNKPKCEISKDKVEYSGHMLTKEGLKASPDRIKALTEMPKPKNKSELETFMGIMVYLAKFVPNLSKHTAPLRALLAKGVAWCWESQHDVAFDTLIRIATTTPTLKFYDVRKPITLSTDASNQGFGAMISQESQPVAYASRRLLSAENNYATIEKEMSAIHFGCTRFHDYIFGAKTRVETDHKPLVGIFQKPLHKLSPRLQRMRMSLLRYDLEVVYVPGKNMLIPDALSRATTLPPTEHDVLDEAHVMSLVYQMPVTDAKFDQIREATAKDPALNAVRHLLKSAWPDRKNRVPMEARPFHQFRDEITEVDGILFRSQQIIIPASMRREMLDKLHESHQGIVKSKQRARSVMFWPGINGQIEDTCAKCSTCMEYRNKRAPEPLMPHEIPNSPWIKVGTDLFQIGSDDYLVLIDYYSKFPEVVKLPCKTAHSVVSALKSVFARSGIPYLVVSDNGPCFNSEEYRQFSKEWGFRIIAVSPGHSQSNGQVENAVKSVKRLMKKAQQSNRDPLNALLEFRNTPLDGTCGYSPSQLLHSRLLRSKLPTADGLLKPHVVPPLLDKLKDRQMKQKYYHDKRCKPISQPSVGQAVRFRNRNRWEYGVITEQLPQPRSVLVESQSGRNFHRNRRHMYPTKEYPPNLPISEDPNDIEVPETPNELAVLPPTPPRDTRPIVTSPPQTRPGSTNAPSSGADTAKYDMVKLRPDVITRSGRVSKGNFKIDI